MLKQLKKTDPAALTTSKNVKGILLCHSKLPWLDPVESNKGFVLGIVTTLERLSNSSERKVELKEGEKWNNSCIIRDTAVERM